MRRSRSTDERVERIIREVDPEPVAEIAKRHGVSYALPSAGPALIVRVQGAVGR